MKNSANGVLVPLEVWADACCKMQTLKHHYLHEFKRAVKNYRDKKIASIMMRYYAEARDLNRELETCEYAAYRKAEAFCNEEPYTLVQLSVEEGDERIKVYVGNLNQCRQKMSRWYHDAIRKNKGGRLCHWTTSYGAIVEDDESGSFRYEWWIKEPSN